MKVSTRYRNSYVSRCFQKGFKKADVLEKAPCAISSFFHQMTSEFISLSGMPNVFSTWPPLYFQWRINSLFKVKFASDINKWRGPRAKLWPKLPLHPLWRDPSLNNPPILPCNFGDYMRTKRTSHNHLVIGQLLYLYQAMQTRLGHHSTT